MAMSNWDTLSFDHEGKNLNGSFKSDHSVKVEFFKNRFNISDKKSWDDSSRFTKPIIGVIHHGYINYKDIQICCSYNEEVDAFFGVV